jgi:hypothetical protein
VPISADIGAVWPALAQGVIRELGLVAEFMTAPQETPEGVAMREWIVNQVTPLDRARVYASAVERWGARASERGAPRPSSRTSA